MQGGTIQEMEATRRILVDKLKLEACWAPCSGPDRSRQLTFVLDSLGKDDQDETKMREAILQQFSCKVVNFSLGKVTPEYPMQKAWVSVSDRSKIPDIVKVKVNNSLLASTATNIIIPHHPYQLVIYSPI
jgi:hypothetical protein